MSNIRSIPDKTLNCNHWRDCNSGVLQFVVKLEYPLAFIVPRPSLSRRCDLWQVPAIDQIIHFKAGADPAGTFTGGDFSNVLQSRLITSSLP